jgi:hypothetical protein
VKQKETKKVQASAELLYHKAPSASVVVFHRAYLATACQNWQEQQDSHSDWTNTNPPPDTPPLARTVGFHIQSDKLVLVSYWLVIDY